MVPVEFWLAVAFGAAVGVTSAYPYWVEKVMSCAHCVTVYVVVKSLSVVAQTMVSVAEYSVEQDPLPGGMEME